MGFYINPKDGTTKEQFLAEHGKELRSVDNYFFNGTHLPVCLVDNGWMTAAGIAFDQSELDAFNRPDGRPKVWFNVPLKALEPYYKP